MELFSKALRFLLGVGVLYVAFISLLATPFVQTNAVYKHALRFPLFANFSLPEKYGLAPGKTLNLKLTTTDNETLGAWFVLSDQFHRTLPPFSLTSPPTTSATLTHALTQVPTILYLHGAEGTRAWAWRVAFYSSFTSRLGVNMLALDYRGFGESSGVPSNVGLLEDAYTAWCWLLDNGAQPENVLIMGHSLGTAVTAQLMKRLAKEYADKVRDGGDDAGKPRGAVMLAPFSSISALVETYAIFGLPVLQPLQRFSLGTKLLKRILRHDFDTLATISDFHVPTLIAHSRLDEQVPYTHAIALVDMLLAPLLPELPTPPAPDLPQLHDKLTPFEQAHNERRVVRSALVQRRDVPGFGIVEEFDRDGKDGKRERRVVYVESLWGTHISVCHQEGVQDEIARTFRLGAHASQQY